MTTEPKEGQDTNLIKTDAKGRFMKGTKGGPGRTPGSISIKDLVRKHLEDNPEDLEEFVLHFIKTNRELAWQMIEGRPSQDVTSGGEKINPMPILGNITQNVQTDSSTLQDTQVKEEA